MRLLRKIVKKIKLDKIKNEIYRQKLNVKAVNIKIEDCQLRLVIVT